VAEGRWNHYDNFRLSLPGAPSHPAITVAPPQTSGGQFSLSWNSVAGWSYRVLRKNALDDPWTTVATLPSAGTTTSYSEDIAAGASAFYQVVRVP
jgi:hypothetical protein